MEFYNPDITNKTKENLISTAFGTPALTPDRIENLVFSGGGTKGIAYVGVLRVLDQMGISTKIKRYTGASAGAIMAALLATGMSTDDIEKNLPTSFMQFLDPESGSADDIITELSRIGKVVEGSIYLQDLELSIDRILGVDNKNEFVNISDEKQLKDKLYKIIFGISKYLRRKDLGNRYSESVSKMLDFINGNYMHDISLDDVAGTVSLHPNYASSLFKKEIGTSFIQYLNSYRIMKAKAFIKRNAELSLEKIAEMVGYENSCHFIKVFKKYSNITPGEYRNKLNL
jgi:two-component system, response regulator YesN